MLFRKTFSHIFIVNNLHCVVIVFKYISNSISTLLKCFFNNLFEFCRVMYPANE